jgi:ribosomal protein S18 acetylase RimI-like enzyme
MAPSREIDQLRLPGEASLVESWTRLAATSPRACVTHLDVGVAAIFPEWSVLNNAIVDRRTEIDVACGRLRALYASAGIHSWALWIASSADTFAADDLVAELNGFRRDTTTLVMEAALHARRGSDARVVRASVATALHASDAAVPVASIDETPSGAGDVEGWVLVHDGFAVSGAWSVIHEGDCGIYSVGTAPACRRRGYARALVDAILDDAFRRDAATASLQSTREAQSLYAAVGFRPVGRYEEWIPEPGSAVA